MKKLTQREYLEDLQCASRFLAASYHMGLEAIKEHIDTIPQSELDNYTIYQYNEVKKRSKDLMFTRKDGTTCYRDLYGRNEYFTHKQILYHVNTRNSRTVIFINK